MSRTIRIPGMVDPHVHLHDLDWAHKATFASETAAALAGGYWAVFDMPNTPPSTINRTALDLKLAAMRRQAVCDWGVYAGAARLDNATGCNGPDLAGMFPDVCGLKIYNNETTGTLLIDDQVVRAQIFRAWPIGKPIAVHAEDETAAQIVELVREFRKPTHFCHICTRYEIGLLRRAKADGLPISIGVTPHHLWLTDDDLSRLGPFGRMKPPLKTRVDQAALWEAVIDGTVDVIESDHAPHTLAEKLSDTPPYGVPGLETTLPLLLTAVHEGRLTLERVVDLVALNAQRIFGLTVPHGTYTVVDVDHHAVLDRQNVRSACGWSPFEGIRLWGKVREVFIRNTKVFDGQTVVTYGGYGEQIALARRRP